MATSITLADLTSCEDGMVLVAKDAIDGSRRHISSVANGKKCGCVCFGCGRNLIAKNGGDYDLKKYHFAHRPDELTPNCATAGETALHILGKEVIAKHGRVTMPETWLPDLDGKRRVVTPRRSIDLIDIHLEMADGEIVPDIIATTPEGRRLFIEIKNTHGCPPEKLEKLAGMDVDVLEIDVSGYCTYALDDLDDVVLDLAPRQVIQSAAVNAMKAKIAEEARQYELARRAEGKRKVAVYRDNRMRTSKRAADLADWMIEVGLSEYMDLDDTMPSAFLVPRRQWQAAILFRLMDTKYPAMVGSIAMLDRLRERNWPKPEINALTSAEAKWIRANVDPDFKSAYEEVLGYLKRLYSLDVVYEDRGSRFFIKQDVVKGVADVVMRIERPEKRIEQSKAAVQAIRELMVPEDGEWIEFDNWIEERASNYGTTLTTLLEDVDSQFDDLMAVLKTIRLSIGRIHDFRQDDPPDDLAGLPLAGLFLRLQLARSEARDRAAREKEARLKQESEARVAEIIAAAEWELTDATSWLAKPLPDYGNKTPCQLAEESKEGLVLARIVIAQIREDRVAAENAENARKKLVNKLEDEAFRLISRRDIATLWLNSSSRDFDGAKPVGYCKNEKSLARCLAVLKDFAANEVKRRRH